MAKIKDDKQEYQYSLPFNTPSGHELTFYDTPGNQRMVISHTSGSHIEFKADGSIFLKSVKDIHTHGSVLSEAGSDATTTRYDADHVLEVGGKLKIKCAELDFEVGSTAAIAAGTDIHISSNNIVQKAAESIALQGTKSVYMDTKEMRERVVSRRSEIGTQEDGLGGVNILNVHGNAIIQNDDPNGGITISSKGYLNLVAGQERVDITGRWTPTPSVEAIGTLTQKVFTPVPQGVLNVSRPGGDYYFESQSSSYMRYATGIIDPKYIPYGLRQDVQLGDSSYTTMVGSYDQTTAIDKRVTVARANFEDVGGVRIRNVGGAEVVNILGIQTVRAARIFLN